MKTKLIPRRWYLMKDNTKLDKAIIYMIDLWAMRDVGYKDQTITRMDNREHTSIRKLSGGKKS
jgi:hypothetical protein